jgi:hypothetical protein
MSIGGCPESHCTCDALDVFGSMAHADFAYIERDGTFS